MIAGCGCSSTAPASSSSRRPRSASRRSSRTASASPAATWSPSCAAAKSTRRLPPLGGCGRSGVAVPSARPSADQRRRTVEEPGAGDGNRTRVASLEDWGSTIELRPRCSARGARPDPSPPLAGTGSRSPLARRVHLDHELAAHPARSSSAITSAVPDGVDIAPAGAVRWRTGSPPPGHDALPPAERVHGSGPRPPTLRPTGCGAAW
jgi:hypothetical protein